MSLPEHKAAPRPAAGERSGVSGASRFATQPIAEAIADERPVDWSPAERALGPQAKALASLRLIEDVARAFRASAVQPPPVEPGEVLFHWGSLAVLERLGEGMTGEVFRAFDPSLHRQVALKLRASRDPASDPANAQLLGEARRLAQIRHRNVLAVYGAAVHDGRAGIWAELIEGRTLAQIVAADGPFGAEEAVAIGLDLCRALGAIHGAGLVHGDVKAENAMRERGGRIVLMDFGASGHRDDLSRRVLVAGTRRYLAPEVLAGAAPEARSDLYALGALLYHLVTASYPRDDDGARVPVAQRRSDLPEALAALIDAAVADDPSQRPADAGAFARALVALLPAPERPAAAPGRFRLAMTAAAVAAVAAIATLAYQLRPPPWSVAAQFVDPATGAALADGTPVRLGDALALQLRASRSSHVYVLNEDADGDLSVLFPLDGLDLTNPLPSGRELELPGETAGRALSWEITSPTAYEEFVAIVSDRPLLALADRLAAADRAELPEPALSRGAGRVRADLPQALAVDGQALAELIALARREHPDPDRLHVQVLRLPHAR